MHAVGEQRRARGDDDERRDQVGEQRPRDRLAFLVHELLLAHAALDYRRLQVELHVGGDRGARCGDEDHDVGRARVQLRVDDRLAHFLPVGVREDGGEGIGEEGDRQPDEGSLGHAI